MLYLIYFQIYFESSVQFIYFLCLNLTYYLYRRSYQVEHFCIETSIMERLHTDYSNKNIPIPTKEEYKTRLISKVESTLKRMCWKALQLLGKLESNKKETYGFKSRKCVQTIDEWIGFEGDLMPLIKNIENMSVTLFKNNWQTKSKKNSVPTKKPLQQTKPVIYIKWKKRIIIRNTWEIIY